MAVYTLEVDYPSQTGYLFQNWIRWIILLNVKMERLIHLTSSICLSINS